MNGKLLMEYLACTVGAAIGFLYGDINGMFLALVALCTLDYITGVMVAIKRHKLNSKAGCTGIMKKITIFMLVCGANFNVYFLLYAKKFKEAFRSEEVLSYLAIYASAAIFVAINIRNFFSI